MFKWLGITGKGLTQHTTNPITSTFNQPKTTTAPTSLSTTHAKCTYGSIPRLLAHSAYRGASTTKCAATSGKFLENMMGLQSEPFASLFIWRISQPLPNSKQCVYSRMHHVGGRSIPFGDTLLRALQQAGARQVGVGVLFAYHRQTCSETHHYYHTNYREAASVPLAHNSITKI